MPKLLILAELNFVAILFLTTADPHVKAISILHN